MVSHACSEFKPFRNPDQHPEARPLGELQEARGKLLRVLESYGQCVGVWAWGAVSLPGELAEELRALIGHEVACLRVDGKYYLRAVDRDA